ncbi:hypothetical protein EVAR_31976_1 [Eumeta japonica]|uniref:Uncharacterized protein n=1 Tax=Eumeta variegata TaxID=151549 RepID=A0A4C1VU31_EUMVA|nr:hypothetical protein EVAR_31976_1 [Eumeta japonica]
MECSDEGSHSDPTMVPAILGKNGSAQALHLDHLPKYRIRRRARPSEENAGIHRRRPAGRDNGDACRLRGRASGVGRGKPSRSLTAFCLTIIAIYN